MMETVPDGREERQVPAESSRGQGIARLRKYTYVLPSGRVLKVVVDEDSGPAPRAATAG